MPLPEKIRNAPELQLGLELYFEAFWDLTSCRSVGFGVGPISHIAVLEYARLHDLDDEQREDLAYYIRAMDGHFLKWEQSKTGKQK